MSNGDVMKGERNPSARNSFVAAKYFVKKIFAYPPVTRFRRALHAKRNFGPISLISARKELEDFSLPIPSLCPSCASAADVDRADWTGG
eukprot:2996283-Rhodomonas_salina.2